MPHRYFILDVFTDTPLTGNPLAVVPDADDLDDARMQALAAEFGLSETAFVQTPANPRHRARLRIFTPRREVPFAGHPTVGAATLIAALDAREDGEGDRLMTFQEGAGAVRIGVRLEGGAPYAEFDIPKLPEPSALKGDPAALAAALGLMPNETACGNHRPSAFDAGLDYAYIPVADEETLARSAPVAPLWKAAFGPDQAAYVYTRVRGGYAARMFDPLGGIAEDPATGSAAAGFAGVLQRFEPLGDEMNRVAVYQGREMGRPSRIDLEITPSGDALKSVRVGGHAVRVAEGVIL